MKKFILLLLVLLSLAVILSGCVEAQTRNKLTAVVVIAYFLIGLIRFLISYGFNPFKAPYGERGLPILLRGLIWPITVSNDIYWWYLKRKRRKEKNQKANKNNK